MGTLAFSHPLCAADVAEAPVAPTSFVLAPGKGLIATTADDRFSFGLRGRFAIRETVAHDGDNTYADAQLRTLRLFVHGHLLTKDLRYVIQLAFGAGDYEPLNPSPIYDAFVDYKLHRDVQIKAGQYFVMFDRARTIREFALQLVDRQQVIGELGLDRDVGITVMSQDLLGLGGRLNYAVGLLGGNGRNRTQNQRAGYLVNARLGVKPWGAFDDDTEGDLERSPRPRLALAIAAAFNDNADRPRSTAGTPYQAAAFDYLHGAADLVFKWHGFSLLAEALARKAAVDRKTVLVAGVPLTESSRSAWGYIVQAGMMVSQKVELAGRWDQLFKLGDTDPALVSLVQKQGQEVGAGINVYLNGHQLKLQADYAARFATEGSQRWQAVRLQLDATF